MHVPTKLVYLTSGKSRRFKPGAQTVEMKDAPQWMLLPSHRAVGEAVRALEWIGEKHVAETLTTLRRKLPPSTVEEGVALRPVLFGWMSKSIGQTFATPRLSSALSMWSATSPSSKSRPTMRSRDECPTPPQFAGCLQGAAPYKRRQPDQLHSTRSEPIRWIGYPLPTGLGS
jgi:hypothetical protein